MVVFLDTEATRRVRVNTVAFDVECVFLITDNGSGRAIFNGIAFKKSDIAKWLLPHQMASLSKYTEDIRMNYLSVIPYGVSYVITEDSEVDPNLTSSVNNVAVLTPNDEDMPDILHYKHHTGTLPWSEMCFSVNVGDDFLALGALSFFTQPTTSSAPYSWFPTTMGDAVEEVVVIPLPDILTAYDTDDIEALSCKINLGYVMPDCAMRDAIYSNYQVIRGNEYGSRESIIDYPVGVP